MAEPQTNPPSEHPVALGPSRSELKKQAKDAEKRKKAAEKAARQEDLAMQKEAADVDFASESYGPILNQSQSRPRLTYTSIGSLTPSLDGHSVVFRARVQNSRAQGNKIVFLNLRQRSDSVQVLLVVDSEKVSKQMVKWAAGLADESIVRVEGIVRKTDRLIKSATVGDVEVHVTKLHLISGIDGRLPFSLEDASRPEADLDEQQQFNKVLLETRLNNRVVDLRTQTNQAIFRLQAALGDLFRVFLNSNGFIEIHTPKLQGAATESGASVFKVSYFKGAAFLAQSPQLAKQMAMAADLERVYEIGPVFRAEDSNTHRHMTEFVGVDLEMTFEEHYHEVMELVDELFKSIFRGLRDGYAKEIGVVSEHWNVKEFTWREGEEGTLKLTFKEAVDLLAEDGVSRDVLDDINTENEKRLGRIIKAKYKTDYFIIDKFPVDLRAFYTMADPQDPTLSNSYDFFMRGEEILSGAQRIHSPSMLIERMKERGIDPNSMKGYIDGFRMGCAPHGGAGIGLERVLMLFLGLGNIRRVSMFPRDPKRLEP